MVASTSYDGSDDADLVMRAVRGDRGAFSTLFARHAAAVYRYAWGLARDEHDAQDLTQEVFVVAWRKLAELRVVEASVLPWLLVTTRNLGRNHVRSAQRRSALPLDETQVRGVASTDDLHWVRGAISELGGTDQRIVRLCLVEGYTYREAAEFLGLSTSAVAKRIERIRIALRARLGGAS